MKLKMPGFHTKQREEGSMAGTRPTYGLTPLGKTKAEEFAATGTRLEVMSFLNENGASSIAEISEQTGLDGGKVKLVVRTLIREGFVVRKGVGD